MSIIKNLKVGARINIGLVVLMIAIIFISWFAISSMNKIGEELDGIVKNDIPLTTKVTKITEHQLEQAIIYERMIRYGETMSTDAHAAEKFEHLEQEFEQLAHKVDEELDQAQAFLSKVIERVHSETDKKEFKHVASIFKEIEAHHASFDEHVLLFS